MGFQALGVPATLREALDRMGYHEPTSVQREALPPILEGRDVLLEAETGSGKTASFGIPAVVVGSRQPGLRVVVLVPTRELARQVAEEVRAIGAGSPFRAVAVTGGVAEEQEARALGGDVRCVVATPGRLLALAEAGALDLAKAEMVVLDEADRMLDMGFQPDVEKVLEMAADRKQTVLVSATLPPRVRALASAHLRDPVEVNVRGHQAPASLEHYRLNVLSGMKEAALVSLLRKENPERAIAFVRTRERANEMWRLLKKAGFAVDRLQGEMSHEQRRHVFDLFSKGVTRVLVATDLASRGLDVPEMQLVVNVDLPEEKDAYLHRAGRAGRLGRAGRVVSLVLPEEKARRIELEAEAGATFTPYRLEVTTDALPEDERPAPPRRPPPARLAAPREERVRPPRDAPREPLPPSRKERRNDGRQGRDE
ncbi:MAG TPA: DEAD/DEAH box helicase [Candidatus Thermoplasmatota archaeon]|nr:DEAD/DEAH box helicase [Candidatus Thermoplasmatota archaeon]